MKIILDRPKGNKRHVVVELDNDEQLFSVKDGEHYRLAYPMDDQVLAAHILAPAHVVWDSLEQKWL